MVRIAAACGLCPLTLANRQVAVARRARAGLVYDRCRPAVAAGGRRPIGARLSGMTAALLSAVTWTASDGTWRDIREQPHGDVLDLAERSLSVSLDRARGVYGNGGVTAGFRTGNGLWLRLQWRPRWRVNCQAWSGLECASAVRGVAMPELHRSLRWADPARDAVWRADEMSLIGSAAISATGSLSADPGLPDDWWDSLARSLSALAAHETDRAGMRQEHLSKRISEVYGTGIDTTVTEWAAAHADMHWGNLTAPGCFLLDWEDWGMAPRGLDVATLWGFSLGVPSLAARIEHEFRADLDTRSGKLAQLLFCANSARAFARHGRQMPFTEPARMAAARLIVSLAVR